MIWGRRDEKKGIWHKIGHTRFVKRILLKCQVMLKGAKIMHKMLEEFVAYAKAEFRLVVKASASKKPESFEEIFGISHMASVFDVAKYILQKSGSMSTWKLHKLCYYSQAWSLAWTEAPIFDEEFEAWANGPVCRELFYMHQGKFVIDENDITKGDPDNLNDDQRETIDVVLHDYGSMEPYELRDLSHNESPWKDARGDLPDDAKCNAIITKTAMGCFYGGL